MKLISNVITRLLVVGILMPMPGMFAMDFEVRRDSLLRADIGELDWKRDAMLAQVFPNISRTTDLDKKIAYIQDRFDRIRATPKTEKERVQSLLEELRKFNGQLRDAPERGDVTPACLKASILKSEIEEYIEDMKNLLNELERTRLNIEAERKAKEHAAREKQAAELQAQRTRQHQFPAHGGMYLGQNPPVPVAAQPGDQGALPQSAPERVGQGAAPQPAPQHPAQQRFPGQGMRIGQPAQQQPSIKQWFTHNWQSVTLVTVAAAIGAYFWFFRNK